jgi:hypothetical protein
MNFTTPVSLNARHPEPEHFRGEGVNLFSPHTEWYMRSIS